MSAKQDEPFLDCTEVARNDSFFDYVEKVQTRMKTLHHEAQQFPEAHTQPLVNTLEELGLAVEELHIAEEELLSQNEQLIAAQQMAEAERQRYQDLFNFAPDGYLVTDIYGVVQEANQAAAALLNLDQNYLIGMPVANQVPKAQRAAFRTLLSQIVASHRIEGWELPLLGGREDVIVAATTVEAVQNAAGEAIALRWQMRDISDLKKAEAALNQLQSQNLELLEVDRLRTQLLATVSHELRTPMNAILGFSQMLMMQFQAQQDAKTTKMVERIFHNGQHLLTLIEDMLHFSRLRANQVQLKLESFDLVELVSETLDELYPLSVQKALTLKANLPKTPLLVTNDRTRLRQILTNLVSNAIKYTDAGRIVVSVQTLPEERLLLEVKDTGCGISPDDQPHIFREFWQVHDARTKTKGTGLGLAIVHALVQVMQGGVTVDSQLGQGSRFRVELPQTVVSNSDNSSPMPLPSA